MVERFHRNLEKNANDDVAECIFVVSEERIQQTYHKENDKISASTQEFIKPPNANEKGAYILWHADTHTMYQVLDIVRSKYLIKGDLRTSIHASTQNRFLCRRGVSGCFIYHCTSNFFLEHPSDCVIMFGRIYEVNIILLMI